MALRRRPSGGGAKPPCAALAEDRRGERQGEGVLDRVRWGPGRRSRKRPLGRPGGRALLRRREHKRSRHRKWGVWLFSRDEPGGRPDYWPGGARREGGVSLVCGSGTEREKASVDRRPGSQALKVARGSVPRQRTGGAEYRLRRSLADRPVVAVKLLLAGVGAERRGRLTRNVRFVQPGPRGSGRKRG